MLCKLQGLRGISRPNGIGSSICYWTALLRTWLPRSGGAVEHVAIEWQEQHTYTNDDSDVTNSVALLWHWHSFELKAIEVILVLDLFVWADSEHQMTHSNWCCRCTLAEQKCSFYPLVFWCSECYFCSRGGGLEIVSSCIHECREQNNSTLKEQEHFPMRLKGRAAK